jgi:hypothetical protein
MRGAPLRLRDFFTASQDDGRLSRRSARRFPGPLSTLAGRGEATEERGEGTEAATSPYCAGTYVGSCVAASITEA